MTTKKAHRVYTTPLPKKLGIASGVPVAIIGAPEGFKDTLGDLPPDTIFTTRLTTSTKLALCFVRSLGDLANSIDMLTSSLPKQASVWLIYPKRTGRYPADFNENHVRAAGLEANLVDYKVCSVDGDWSALKFAHRKSSSRSELT